MSRDGVRGLLGVEFIDENGGGPGGKITKAATQKRPKATLADPGSSTQPALTFETGSGCRFKSKHLAAIRILRDAYRRS